MGAWVWRRFLCSDRPTTNESNCKLCITPECHDIQRANERHPVVLATCFYDMCVSFLDFSGQFHFIGIQNLERTVTKSDGRMVSVVMNIF